MEFIILLFAIAAAVLALLSFLEIRNSRGSSERLERFISDETARSRDDVAQKLKNSGEATVLTINSIAETQFRHLTEITAKQSELIDSNRQLLEKLRQSIEEKLSLLQKDNAEKLDKMRATVDEKLQTTLEKRLGESFKIVSERLEQVYRGLGEMQTLAAGVGDLKRVLTNVKSRGTWGEVQLGAMLEQILTAEQFTTNFSPKNNMDRVEFAIRMPGRDGSDTVYLPIDAKFPVEDYRRLLDAEEAADMDGVAAAARQLENSIRNSAKEICAKYLNPPVTTDFAIMYLPSEGLFAEVIRRPDLCDTLQRTCRVVVAGPTTLWSILNSLQMGFRTLAIEKRSSEVWKTLEAVKSEWLKYAESLEAVQKKIQSASDSIGDAQIRVRAIGRKLKGVQELADPAESETLLTLNE